METAVVLVHGRVKSVTAIDRSKTIEVEKWYTRLTVDVDSVEPKDQSIPAGAVYAYNGRLAGLREGVRVVLHIQSQMINSISDVVRVQSIDVL